MHTLAPTCRQLHTSENKRMQKTQAVCKILNIAFCRRLFYVYDYVFEYVFVFVFEYEYVYDYSSNNKEYAPSA